jgi:uncharacterized protein YdeI (YjbR/CyaY-like superfamily)
MMKRIRLAKDEGRKRLTSRLDGLQRVEIASVSELRTWLEAEHDRTNSHWLVTYKKSDASRYVPYNEIVEELLCFGWIDSLPRSLDDKRSMLLISPRKLGSNWSKDNRERVAKLQTEGRMARAGQACVDAAKADGSWDRLKQTENGEAPNDLAAALAAADAGENWQAFSLSVRRRSLEFLLSAKREETRRKRIEQIVAASRIGVDPTLWKPKS